MSISRLVDTDDSGDGVSGTVHNNAWLQALQDKIDLLVGDWTDVTFAAGNFTASSGSWTVDAGDVQLNRYQIINKTLFWYCVLTNTTVSTTPASLRIAIPTGTFKSGWMSHHLAYLKDNATIREGMAIPGDGTHLYLFRSDGSAFSTATDATTIYVSGFWELT